MDGLQITNNGCLELLLAGQGALGKAETSEQKDRLNARVLDRISQINRLLPARKAAAANA